MKSRTCSHFVTLTTLKRGRPKLTRRRSTQIRADGDQQDLVRSQKSGSRSTEMEDNSGRPMSPMRGLDDDDDD